MTPHLLWIISRLSLQINLFIMLLIKPINTQIKDGNEPQIHYLSIHQYFIIICYVYVFNLYTIEMHEYVM